MALSEASHGFLVSLGVFVVLCPCIFYFILWPRLRDDEENLEHKETVVEVKKKNIDPPAIVIAATQSSEDSGVEASLASFTVDSQDLEAQDEPKMTRTLNDQSVSRSNLSSKLSHDHSVSEQATSVDVHICNSSSCELCRQKNSVTFVAAKPLEPQMIGKLRQGPTRWWEIGESFFDLYTQANRSNQTNRVPVDDDENFSTWGLWSRMSKSSKIIKTKRSRSLKYVSSDGDEGY